MIENILESRLGDYYRERIRIHMSDSYAGIRMRKFPEDLRVIEHTLWEHRINVVLEIGLGLGGSALWLRDRLRTLAGYGRITRPLVISVDRTIGEARDNLARIDPAYADTIRLVESDVCDPGVLAKVHRHLRPDARVFLIDDSAHRYDTTLATLRQFADLVPLGSYVLVEDGHRDYPGMLPAGVPHQAHGVVNAIRDWLSTEGAGRFIQERSQERYIVTSNPGGWLRRVG